jgi:hypothetical protein
VLGIFGGFSSVNICYLIPVYCYIKLRHDELKTPKNILGIAFMAWLCFLGWGSVVVTIMKVAQGE